MSRASRGLLLGCFILILSILLPDSFAQDICDTPITITGPRNTLAIVPDVVVRADTIIGESNPAVCVSITNPGHYRIYATISQSLGQFNESYFLTICDENGNNCKSACDPNAGDYKIVLDDTVSAVDTVTSDAGVFFLEAGNHIIQLNHLALIDDQFPQLVRGDSISEAESVHLIRLVLEETNETFNVALSQTVSQGSVRPDSIYSYSLSIQNIGSATIHNINLWDAFPDFVTPEQFTLNPPVQVTADTLFWFFDTLGSAQALNIEFTVRFSQTPPSTPFDLVNTAQLTANCDTTLSNNRTATTVVGLPPIQYDLALTKTASRDSVKVGDSVLYNIKIVNNGPDPARDITLSDVLPGVVSISNFTLQPNSVNQDTVFWQFDVLAVRDSIEISFSAKVEGNIPSFPFQIINEAHVEAPLEVDPGNSSAIAVVTAIPITYDLELSKSANKDSVQIGQTISYLLKVINNGPDPASDIILSDILPNFLSATDFSLQPNSVKQDTLFWQFDSLAVGDSIAVSFTARVEESIPSLPSQIRNIARVTAPLDINSDNSAAIALVTAIPVRYDLEITKSASIDTVRPGATLRYTLEITNRGPDTAENVTIQEIQPEFVDFLDFNTQPSSISQDTLFWQVDSLIFGELLKITIDAKVGEIKLTDPLQITNNVLVTAIDDVNSANNTASASITVLPPNDCVYLDRNVFVPDSGSPLQVIFQLSTSRTARLDLYDVTGYHLGTLVERNFNAGINTYLWDGTNQNGKKVGSGVYIITLRSGGLVCWVKVIVVQ